MRSDPAEMEGDACRYRNSSDGVTPSIRRNVLVKCAASENPALHAAEVTLAPALNSQQARRSRRQSMYGRNGTPMDSVKTCMNREGERPEIAARVFRETSLDVSSLSRIDLSARLTRG